MGRVGEVVVHVQTDRRESNRFEIREPRRSFCSKAFCCLGTCGLIPLATGTIALLGGFGDSIQTQGGCFAFAAGVGLTFSLETCLLMTVLQEIRSSRTRRNELN